MVSLQAVGRSLTPSHPPSSRNQRHQHQSNALFSLSHSLIFPFVHSQFLTHTVSDPALLLTTWPRSFSKLIPLSSLLPVSQFSFHSPLSFYSFSFLIPIPVELKKQSSCLVHLINNNSSHHVAFKVPSFASPTSFTLLTLLNIRWVEWLREKGPRLDPLPTKN